MYERNKRKRKYLYVFLVGGIILISLMLVSKVIPARAETGFDAPVMQQPIYTPTPLPDGRIIYIVKKGDSLLRISIITGVPLDELRGMNNLVGDNILIGQELLLGFGGPAEEIITPGPTPTPTSLVPSPTPGPGNGHLCILLFNDINGDSLRQEDEPSLSGGAISIKNRMGTVSLTEKTGSGFEAYCFKEQPEGEYTISVAVPEGYNPTTKTSYQITLEAGDETYIDFGAQANSEKLAEAPLLPQEGEKSPLFGIVGGVIIILGIGLALFANRLFKGK
jgi:hypothetical protein